MEINQNIDTSTTPIPDGVSSSPNNTNANPFAELEALEAKGKKAGFFARLGAFSIDWFLATFLVGFIGSFFGVGSVDLVDGSYSANISGLGGILVFAYFIIADVKYGRTLGKKIFKLKVVDAETGGNLTWGKAFLREFVGRFLNSISLSLGYLWMLWDKDKQGWHDKLGKSYVENTD